MKKILASVLTAAMMLSMSAAVMADETPTYTDDDVVYLTKKYALVGDTTAVSPAETFEYEIVYGAEIVETDDDGEIVYKTDNEGNITDEPKTKMVYVTDSTIANEPNENIYVPAVGTVAFAAGDAGNTVDGEDEDTDADMYRKVAITIDEDKYSTVGIYYYTITEKVKETAGVTYYTSPIVLKVTVIQDTETDKIEVAAVHTETPYDGSVGTKGQGTKLDEITNTYSAGTLEVSKTVTGNLGDQTQEFKVTVKFTSDLEVKSAVTYYDPDTAKEVDGSVTYEIETLKWTKDEITNKWNATANIELNHGETIKFENLPYGVTYSIEEDDYTDKAEKPENQLGYDDASYDYTYMLGNISVIINNEGTNTINGKLVTVEDVCVVDCATEKVSIINNKDSEVDTGISVDSIPYIAILGVVAIGGTGFIVSKKRHSED